MKKITKKVAKNLKEKVDDAAKEEELRNEIRILCSVVNIPANFQFERLAYYLTLGSPKHRESA